MLYLDNNATTIMPQNVISTICAWMNKGNPSASYKTAAESRQMMKDFRNLLAKTCGVISYEPDEKPPKDLKKVYQFIITSCASESNNTLIRSVAAAYVLNMRTRPHILSSSIEHKSLLDCLRQLATSGQIELTLLKPTHSGHIDPADIAENIRSNTCLVAIMAANNETGAIMDLRAIGAAAHDAGKPFFTDAVQYFGKFGLRPIECGIDAFVISFHKFHGPPGIGILAIRREFIRGYKLQPEICGSQNCGFRGGTENVPAIAGAYEALKMTFADRAAKNQKMKKLKEAIAAAIMQKMPAQTYIEYLESPKNVPVLAVFLTMPGDKYLPNTLMISIVKRSSPPFCNIIFKRDLEAAGIIVSIGSACNTSAVDASHVLYEMDADEYVRRGAIRISLDETITAEHINKLIGAMMLAIKKQCG